MDLISFMPARLIIGKGCVLSSAGLLAGFGKKALLVTGRHAAKACGALPDAEAALASNGQSWVLFDRIGANPQLTDCMAAAALAQESQADFIIGIGGGSPLDAAKCIAVLAANPGMRQAQLYGFDWANAPLPIVCVGTTAGTGSEVTKVSVITTPDGRKKSFHHEQIFPRLSLGDPAYTMTMPASVTVSTMVDVLAHCTESFFSRAAHHLSQVYAAEGIRLLLPVMQAMADGTVRWDYGTRENVYLASIYGGLAINETGTCFPHTVGYLLTEQYHVPHGVACAVFLDDFYAYNREVAPDLADAYLERIGCTEEVFLALLRAIVPTPDVVMTEADIQAAHSRWIGNGSIAKCQGVVEPERIDRILRKKFIK